MPNDTGRNPEVKRGMMERRIPILALIMAVALPAWAAPEDGSSVETAKAGTAEEMLTQAKDTISYVQDGQRRANKVREQADRDSDAKLADCISAPYQGLRTLERVATKRFDEMTGMIADGDVANAGRVYRSMVIIRDKASAFIAQADACTTDGTVQDGKSMVNSNTDALTDGDDTDPLLDDSTVDIDPPSVTPFE